MANRRTEVTRYSNSVDGRYWCCWHIGAVCKAINVANNTYTTLTNTGSLPAGQYLFCVDASFASNANGYREAIITNSNTSTSSVDRYSAITQPPSVGKATNFQFAVLMNISTATTFYLRVYQNSGSTLSCGGGIRTIRLHL